MLALLYMMNGESGVKSAKKAFDLEKNEICFSTMLVAMVQDKNFKQKRPKKRRSGSKTYQTLIINQREVPSYPNR
jgi:hypothetical protein